MRNVIRIVKRGDREEAKPTGVVEGGSVRARRSPEMIIKEWIAGSRQRRRAEAEESLRNFRRWDGNLSASRA